MPEGLTDRLPSPWSRLWQVPLLLVGIGLFAYGLYRFRQTRHPLPFETHAADIQHLLDAERYTDALKQIAAIQNFYVQPAEQAQLERLAGDAFFYAQQKQPGLVRQNYEKAIDHYRRAATLGLPESAALTRRWGLSSLALGDYPDAIHRLEKIFDADPAQVVDLARCLVTAYLKSKPPEEAKALAVLTALTKAPKIDDRVWAHTQRLELTLGKPGVETALADAKAVVGDIKENNPAGVLLTWIGRAEYEAGRLDEAQASLLEARQHFAAVGHSPDEARAAILLGKIAQAKAMRAAGTEREPFFAAALKQYQDVITSHAGSLFIPAARLGRAEILAFEDRPDEQMQADYRWVIKTLQTDAERGWELISLDAVGASILTQQDVYQQAGRSREALEFLELYDLLKVPENASLAYRRATAHELRAEQLAAELNALEPAAPSARRNERFEQILHHRSLAAEAYLRHARFSTMNDAASGDSQWKAAHLFDQAGRSQQAIAVFNEFAVQRPGDARVPEALHTIGLLYQSLGKFDQAIPFYQRNIKENPKTPASYLSTIQLARCYMAQGETEFPKAEQALLSLVQDSRDLLPSANEFRISLFTLGELYYRTRRWADAILRLEEAITRYPQDNAVPRATFWLADSYRKSAAEIADAIKKNPAIDRRDQLEQAQQERLRRAATLFGQVIAQLDPDPDNTHPAPVAATAPAPAQPDLLATDYLRYSYLYRADCHFDLNDYPAAIKYYELAATRFSQSITAVEAYVQIINAHLAMKDPGQARAAAERARWILQHVPDDAFGKPPLGLTRDYYANIFRLGRSGSLGTQK